MHWLPLHWFEFSCTKWHVCHRRCAITQTILNEHWKKWWIHRAVCSRIYRTWFLGLLNGYTKTLLSVLKFVFKVWIRRLSLSAGIRFNVFNLRFSFESDFASRKINQPMWNFSRCQSKTVCIAEAKTIRMPFSSGFIHVFRFSSVQFVWLPTAYWSKQ